MSTGMKMLVGAEFQNSFPEGVIPSEKYFKEWHRKQNIATYGLSK